RPGDRANASPRPAPTAMTTCVAGLTTLGQLEERRAERACDLSSVRDRYVVGVHPRDRVADDRRAPPLEAHEATGGEEADAELLGLTRDPVVRRERAARPRRRAHRHRRVRRE